MAALWDLATPQERREMVLLMLEPAGLYYDLEQKIIAALKPRPAFLPILRMLNGIVEYDEARGLLLVERWQERNRRASSRRSLPAHHQLPLAPGRGVVVAASTYRLRRCYRKQRRYTPSLSLPCLPCATTSSGACYPASWYSPRPVARCPAPHRARRLPPPDREQLWRLL